MREILFRGFTPDENGRETITVSGKQIKGEWVQGSYWELRETTYCFQSDYDMHPDNTKHYIVFDRMTDWGLPNRHLQADVIPETVGQFTGLFDKNGKKIFEGDIISGLGNTYVCRWDEGNVEFTVFDGNESFGLAYAAYPCMEVVGNIHDNPELLKNEHPAIL